MLIFSIIIPYYNADKWIGRMLDSLLKQDISKDEYEIIVVDDGSKDEPVVLKGYVQLYPNIYYVRQENAGPATARNTGIAIAKGEYVFFCDSDDYISENVLGGLYNIAHSKKMDILFHNVITVYENEKIINPVMDFDKLTVYNSGQDYLGEPVARIRTGVWQFIIKNDLINRADLAFPANWIMNEDSSFFIDALLSAGKVGKVDVDAYYYVQNSQSILHSSGKKMQADKFVNNILMFVSKLTNIIENKDVVGNILGSCLDNLILLRNAKGAFAVFVSSRYLSFSKVKTLFSELETQGVYPFLIKGNHKMRLRLMNMRYLWLLFCYVINLLPLKIRYRLL